MSGTVHVVILQSPCLSRCATPRKMKYQESMAGGAAAEGEVSDGIKKIEPQIVRRDIGT